VTAPLRIGILGAARIADEGIVDPAKTLGHELVAVAARDRARAEAFAAERGIAKVHDGYADVIADPDVDLVYNALVNSLLPPGRARAPRHVAAAGNCGAGIRRRSRFCHLVAGAHVPGKLSGTPSAPEVIRLAGR
jgi:hypothetical protein